MQKLKSNIKKYIKKTKKYLVKKVTLTKIEKGKDSLVYELHLKNFWSIVKNIEVYFECEDLKKNLQYHLANDVLRINIPIDLLHATESKGKIQLKINNKNMWIKTSEEFEKKADQSLLVGNRYFLTRVNKNIYLYNKFNEFNFQKEKVLCSNFDSAYGLLRFQIKDMPSDIDAKKEKVDIYAFQNHKMRILEASYNRRTEALQISDFTVMFNGKWRLFLHLDQTLYPLAFVGDGAIEFHTFNHIVQVNSINNNFYLDFKPHLFSSELISFIKEENDHVSIHIETKVNLKNAVLIMEDNKTNGEFLYPLQKTSEGLLAIIPIKDLWNNYSRKRFFIESKENEPKKYQFLLDQSTVIGSASTFEIIIDSQIALFSFYIRKDRSLGCRVMRPVLKKLITDIKDFKLNGFIGSLDKFIDCEAFLTFEERGSMSNIKIPIDDQFNINLRSLNLIEVKTKEKSIIDIYIEIINQQNEVVRKEKIKYKFADYKKDNYYDHIELLDAQSNIHHFLVTTTPFNNVKIETFTIPNGIVVPLDTSMKDDNVWLIGERYNTAQDNGIVLHQWLRENTNIESYYVIEKDALDYEQVKGDPYVLTFGSEKHYEIAFKAGVLLGTHDLENILPYKTAKGFFHYEDTYKVFLQHGVLGRKNVEYHKKYYDTPFDLFIVSSDPEKYDIVVDIMGYEEDEVAVTGLARFDRLVQKEEPKDILLMPTWRDWINTDQQFLESEYYSAYLNLIKNKELHQLLDKYDVNLHFYPHYRAQDFFERNVDINDHRIKFIPFGSRKVQDLLIEHALLITDYSTVSFDFIKMDKPVIYYHFDVGRFFQRGILRPIEETFIGGIAHTEEEILNLIKDRLKNGLQNFDTDISGVIKYQDRHNCERIYAAVCNELTKKKEIAQSY